MNFNISSWSIRNPTPGILLFVILSIAGLLSFAAMKVQNFPEMDFPIVKISATLPGASPSQLETEVARKIENALATVQGVKHINTTLIDGTADISVEFRVEKATQEAVDDVRDAISRVRGDLPAALRDPTVKKVESSGSPILTFTVDSSHLDDEELSWYVDNEVSKTLLGVAGVGSIRRVGGVTREVRVELDSAQLLALKTTALDISRQIRQIQQDAAGGRTELGGAEQSVRTLATVQSAEELAAMEIVLGDGRHIRLNQVAIVSDTVATPRSAAFLDGRPVVSFEVTRARGAGDLEVAAGVRKEVEMLKNQHPGIRITEAHNGVDPVQENYAGSMNLLYEGAALAVLVVFIFLRDWRATFVAAVALPLSVIPTFVAMYLMDFTLNVVSLLSLSLVVGVLVDDAIVEIENIERHLRMGKTPLQAAMEAADEIGLAVVATTFTLIAVFLPTAFMQGTIGKVFVQFGWTAAVAVFFSLLVARVLTPMMAAYLLRPSVKKMEHEPDWIQRYLGWARWALQHRALTIFLSLAFLVLGQQLASRLPSGFIPPDDASQTQITLSLPAGSRLSDTVATADRAQKILRGHMHVQHVYAAVGGGSSGGGGPGEDDSGGADMRKVNLTVSITHRNDRPGISQVQIEQELGKLLASLPGVRVSVGGDGSDDKYYTVVLAGDDSRLLLEHSALVERDLRTLPGVGGVTSSAGLVQPELIVKVDFARAADLGVTSAAIAESLRVATAGDYDQELAKLNLGERQVPVVVRLSDSARRDIETLRRLPVLGVHGPVALENVATLEIGSSASEITRRDRSRNVNLQVELNGTPLGEVETAALALPSLSKLPPGVKLSVGGESEQMAELATGFGVAMSMGVLCIYIVLVLLLKDFVQPVTILSALVLSVPGAFFALYITGSALTMPSMIGLIMLMGIATKNSILLVDYTIMARTRHGLGRFEAVIDACRKRARPIVMTTIAMGAGMLPVALGWGGDPSFRSPMAIVVIGGLISSTFLSLLVVPVVFTYVDDFADWIRSTASRSSDRPAPLLREPQS